MNWRRSAVLVISAAVALAAFAAAVAAASVETAQRRTIATAPTLSQQLETEWDALREQLGLSPRLALRRLSSVASRKLGPGAIQAAAGGVATTPAEPSTDPGNAYCYFWQDPEFGNRERGIHQAWPARSDHQYTLTFPLFVYAPSLDFADATVARSVGLLQVGTDFYSFSLLSGEVRGPLSYDEAHADFVWVEDTVYSVAVNAVYYLDGKGMTGPEYLVLDATGPNAIGGPFCRLM
jgi:hypothetical protein